MITSSHVAKRYKDQFDLCHKSMAMYEAKIKAICVEHG
jgi:hypothetical protein